MTNTMKGQLNIVSNQAETLLSSSKADFFNQTPRIVSPLDNYANKAF